MRVIKDARRIAETVGCRRNHATDTLTDAVIDELMSANPTLRFGRAKRVHGDGTAFERINRHGTVYYAKSSYRVLIPYHTEGTGLQFVKGSDLDPTGVFFTELRWATPVEVVEAVKSYLFAYGIPREGLVVLPASAWPHAVERVAEGR